jgi:hypothetical protein
VASISCALLLSVEGSASTGAESARRRGKLSGAPAARRPRRAAS